MSWYKKAGRVTPGKYIMGPDGMFYPCPKKLFKDCLPNVASEYNALGNPYSKNWFQQVMSNNFAFVIVSPNNIQFDTSTKNLTEKQEIAIKKLRKRIGR